MNRKQLLLSAAVCAALKITVGAPAMAWAGHSLQALALAQVGLDTKTRNKMILVGFDPSYA